MISASETSLFFSVIASGTIIFLFLALCLFAGAIFRRMQMVARSRRIGPLIERWRGYFSEAADPNTPIPPVRYGDVFMILNLWNKLHQDDEQPVSESQLDELEALGRRVGLARIASTLLSRGDENDRIVAITTLGYLRDHGAADAARGLARHRNGDLSFAAHRALVLIEPDEITGFLRDLPGHADWSITEVERFLRQLPAERTVAAFRHALDEAGRTETITLLRYLPACQAQGARAAALAVLEAISDTDVATAALRALTPHGQPADRPVIRRFIDRAQPVHLRLAALNALLPLCDADDRDVLVSLVGDASYWLRYRAAQGLIRLPHGAVDVARLIRHLEDRYSRDILAQALAEHAWDASRAVVSQDAHRHKRSIVRNHRHRADTIRTEI